MQIWPIWLAGLVSLVPAYLQNLLCELREISLPISVSFPSKEKSTVNTSGKW